MDKGKGIITSLLSTLPTRGVSFTPPLFFNDSLHLKDLGSFGRDVGSSVAPDSKISVPPVTVFEELERHDFLRPHQRRQRQAELAKNKRRRRRLIRRRRFLIQAISLGLNFVMRARDSYKFRKIDDEIAGVSQKKFLFPLYVDS